MGTDRLLRLSNEQAITATAVSTDKIDLRGAAPQNRDIGGAKQLYMNVHVAENFATATSLTIQIVSSANADLSSHHILAATDAIPIANLVTSRKDPISLAIPPHALIADAKGRRYLGARYLIGGSNATAGKVTTFITDRAPMAAANYDSGYVVT